MEKLLLKSLIATTLTAALLAAVGCAKAKEKSLETDKVAPMVVVSGKVDTTDTGSIEGSGLLRFSQSLASDSAPLSLDLKAALPNAGSTLTILSHGDRNLNGGVAVMLGRQGNLVTGSITVAGSSPARIAGARLSQQLPNSLAFTIEIRNSGNMPRILMWPLGVKTREDRDAFFDSFQSGHLDRSLPLQRSNGIESGLQLIDAEVLFARPL